jgi:hypothetical protein
MSVSANFCDPCLVWPCLVSLVLDWLVLIGMRKLTTLYKVNYM